MNKKRLYSGIRFCYDLYFLLIHCLIKKNTSCACKIIHWKLFVKLNVKLNCLLYSHNCKKSSRLSMERNKFTNTL